MILPQALPGAKCRTTYVVAVVCQRYTLEPLIQGTWADRDNPSCISRFAVLVMPRCIGDRATT